MTISLGHDDKQNHGTRRQGCDLLEDIGIPETNNIDQLHICCIRTELIANRSPPESLKFRLSRDHREILCPGMQLESEF